jgi:adenylate cyclase
MAGLTPRLLAVDPSPEWHGVIYYNLACHYALTGMPDKALDSLQASLELNPGLKEWSRQDSDLLPLHGHPQFSAVVGSDT